MSRKERAQSARQPDTNKSTTVEKKEPDDTKNDAKTVEVVGKRRVIPRHRRCPLCWGGKQGAGRCYSSHGRIRYYKCSQCGHGWKVTFKPSMVISTIDKLDSM